MRKIIEVRNIKLGEGMPKVCVPIMGKNNEELIREIQLRFAMQRKEYYITHKAIIEIEVLDGVLMQKLKKYLANNGYYCYNINNTLIISKYRDWK